MLARNRTSLASDSLGQLRLEALEDAQLGVERLARVQVPAVLALPEEGLAAGDPLDPETSTPRRRITSSCASPKSSPTGADDADVVEEGGREGEMDSGAAEHPLALAEGGLDGVVGDRSDNGDWHRRAP